MEGHPMPVIALERGGKRGEKEGKRLRFSAYCLHRRGEKRGVPHYSRRLRGEKEGGKKKGEGKLNVVNRQRRIVA